jgi:exonuclease VII small subunit
LSGLSTKWGGRPAKRAGGDIRLTDDLSIDSLLDSLDKVIARLAEAKEPIEDLAVAYEDGVRLLAEAQARLTLLEKQAAG